MTSAQKPCQALAGIRVLDLSRILAGPTATQLLGDFGADIIKIERPGEGDDTRSWGPPFVVNADGSDSDESAYYLCANRNKRSVALDISTPEGAQTVRELLQHCDVLVENFKVGGLKKYGLSYEDLRSEFPQLVYCSITGFGQTGPNAGKPGYDLLAQGYGGIMSLTGPADGEPAKVAVGISDVMTGMYAATAILAALRHRDNTGAGQQIDIALVDCQVAWLVNEGTNYLLSGNSPKRRGNQHPNIVPYQVFEAGEGHLIIAVGNDAQFRRFCLLLKVPEWAVDALFATNAARLVNRDMLVERISALVKEWNRDELIEGMEALGIPCGPINTLPQVFSSDQVVAREMKVRMNYPDAKSGAVDLIGNPVRFSGTPVSYYRPPPRCGADTEAVLQELLPMKLLKTSERNV